jgi:hypothetical protein
MATSDLITIQRAKINIPSATSANDPAISYLVSAASAAVVRYCRRDFLKQTYDELYSGNGDRRLILRQYPLLSIQSVRYRPVTVLKVINSLANTPQARVAVTSSGLTLTRVTSGVMTTSSLGFAGNVTVTALQAAINALGSGWSAQGTGYDQWPSADIYFANGISGAPGPQADSQGALTAAGQNAELKLHTYELAGYQIDQRRGWLLRAIPYTDPELLHPEDLIWPVGINNFRVQYSAGYAYVPDDVQEACAELVASWFQQLGRDLTLQSESVARTYSYSAEHTSGTLPNRVKALLKPYRYHPALNASG